MLLENIRVVLVETSHPGNIGAAARAIKTMGITRLILVRPRQYPCAEATARAAGADDVLAQAQVVETLPEALQGANFVLGTSARLRALEWPVISPREAGAAMTDQPGELALVFGRERTGLTNEELSHCHKLIHIPVNPDYSSLNLAAAVQLLAYEMRLVCGKTEQPVSQAELPAEGRALEGFYAHLESTLIDSGYLNPDQPKFLLPRLRRLFNRAQPTSTEINILRGILHSFSRS